MADINDIKTMLDIQRKYINQAMKMTYELEGYIQQKFDSNLDNQNQIENLKIKELING